MKRSLKKACAQRLHDTFGMPGFRPGQFEAVRALLSCRDVICILPTGAGKSLCWQLPALVHPGLTVVVSPLIALMRDQVEHLRALGIPAVSLDSLMEADERDHSMEQLRSGKARIAFVSPERLLQTRFRRLCADVQPWLLVVDEAHCIVQWGDGFRPAYSEIGQFIRQLPVRPTLCALTATADQEIQQEIRESLGMRRPRTVLLPVVRENLRYDVRTTLDGTADILRCMQRSPVRTVVFCRTRSRTEKLSDLMKRNGISSCYYHAGLMRDERQEVQRAFACGSVQVLCATTAFGMGIDIPDIRRIIHDEMPDNIIDFVQQSGRAGRDGVAAECIVFVEPKHLVRRADIWNKSGAKWSHHPFRRWRKNREKCRAFRKLLRVLLSSGCIVSGIAHAFGQRTRPCGVCSACRRGPMLRSVPDIGAMKGAQVRQFLLKWQRDALAQQVSRPPGKVMPEWALRTAAKRYVFPAGMDVPQEMQRMLLHLRGEDHA